MKNKKKRVREITDYIKFVISYVSFIYIVFYFSCCFRQLVTLLQITME